MIPTNVKSMFFFLVFLNEYILLWVFRWGTFWPKSGSLFKKNPKNWTFHITCGSIEELDSIEADTVFHKFIYYHIHANKMPTANKTLKASRWRAIDKFQIFVPKSGLSRQKSGRLFKFGWSDSLIENGAYTVV